MIYLIDHILIQILSFADVKTIVSASRINKDFFRAANSKQLWAPFCVGLLYSDTEEPSMKIYRERRNLRRFFGSFELGQKNSKVSLVLGQNTSWSPPVPTTHIAIDDKVVFDLGSNADTLSAWLEKKDDTEAIASALRSSSNAFTKEFIMKLGSVLPRGNYHVCNYPIKPVRVIRGEKNDYFSNGEIMDGMFVSKTHDVKTDYYRHYIPNDILTIESNKFLQFHFIMPIQSKLNEKTVKKYEAMIDAGVIPCVFAISVVMQYNTMSYAWKMGNSTDYSGHLVMLSLILDGHHKIRAAANLGKQCKIINYIMTGNITKYMKKEPDYIWRIYTWLDKQMIKTLCRNQSPKTWE